MTVLTGVLFFNRRLKRNQVSDKNIKPKKFVVPIVQDNVSTEKFIHIRSILLLASSIPSSDGARRDFAIPLSLVSVVTLCESLSLDCSK